MKKPAAMTYQDEEKIKTSFDAVRSRLKLRSIEAKNQFSQKHDHVNKFLAEHGIDLAKIREHSAKIIGTGAIASSLALNAPIDIKSLPAPSEIVEKFASNSPDEASQKILLDSLSSVLPENVRPLTKEEEKAVEGIFAKIIGINVKANLEGEHLNTTYGRIGAEQHLRRYPGDTLANHGSDKVLKEGMAPGLGAWGYFAYSKDKLSPDLIETEKWYAVVQTLYLPDWSRRQPYLRDWYKYRKVLIVNTINGNAVVASIADSGPAAWTGKHYGGSPEVMDYLGGPRYKKGNVLLFFVDDPENKVPLGPVEYNKISVPASALTQI